MVRVRAGGVVTIFERFILKKDGGVVLEGVGRALHLIGCIFTCSHAISTRIGVLAIA
jgi:hypothetical protein